MKRILFLTIPEKGHINPMIGPAVWLRQMGYEVRFHAAHDISSQLHAAGLEALEMMTEAPPPPDLNRGAFFAQKVRDQAWLHDWIRLLLIEQSPAQVEPLAQAVAAYAPDVMVTDPMIYPAGIVATRLGIPWVALSNSLNPVLAPDVTSDLLKTLQVLAPARQELFASHGVQMRFSGCDMLSPHLTVAFTTAELIGREVPGVQMVGPSIPPAARGDEAGFPWEKLRVDRPVIYMSYGSQIYHQPRLFERVAAATAEMGVQVVMVVNELMRTDWLGRLPAHVLPCHYAPQLALLPKVRAFITHGGANSVMEALRFGVPLLISPVCNDQFHQAHYIRRRNVGRVLDLDRAGEAEIRHALETLLHDEEVAASVRQVAESYAVDGARRAAELIAALAQRREGGSGP